MEKHIFVINKDLNRLSIIRDIIENEITITKAARRLKRALDRAL